MANKILVIAFIFFCFELGLLLVIFPWSPYWENDRARRFIPFETESKNHSIISKAMIKKIDNKILQKIK